MGHRPCGREALYPAQSEFLFRCYSDPFPDVVTSGLAVQYSPMTGGLEGQARQVGAGGDPVQSQSQANSYGLGGDYAYTDSNARGSGGQRSGSGLGGGKGGNTGQQMPTLGLSADVSAGTSSVASDLIDVNGDGLPDRVYTGGGAVSVQLNLGYGFAPAEAWGSASINDSKSHANSIGGSIGFNSGDFSFAGGINTSEHKSVSAYSLQDVNGDGLPDRIAKAAGGFNVGLNTGAGFAPDVFFPSGVAGEIANSRQETQGGGVYFTVNIALTYVTIVINPGANYERTVGRTEATIADVNGDGYPDYLASTSDGALTVSLNTRGRTNLLRGVTRPLGAAIAVDYSRAGDTYADPHHRWALSSVVVNDGQPGDGVDVQARSFAYSGGFYERRERQFYGFAQVIENDLDAANGNAVYRIVTRDYNTSTYYLKGLLAKETLTDASGRKYTESANTYVVRDEGTGQPLANPADLTAVGFPQLARTDKAWFEGQSAAGKTTYQTYA